MTDLIAELAEVVRLSEAATPGEWFAWNDDCYARVDACPDGPNIANTGRSSWPESTDNAEYIAALSNLFRNNHATLTRIIESEATLSADHERLVIRLGEVTEKLEAAKRDADSWRSLIASVGAEQIVAASKKFGDAEGVLREAARYRWLRDRALQFERDEGEAGTPYCVYGLGMGDCEPTWGTELDTMTDDCMKLDEQQVAAMRDSTREDGNE